MKMGCRQIETIIIEVFARNRWRFSNRIMSEMLHLELLASSVLLRNFVFEIAWTFMCLVVIRNRYMH
jgi:hypothetical protein